MTFSIGSLTIEIRNSSFYLETARHEFFISKGVGVVHSRKPQRGFPDQFASA
ncbi:hypothetical protein [Rhizobium leguminosarum]|uniref:hypothetical protein n=1 Tax=Rhizobium leguminosarum TaxID=384 RepID=UPI000166815C|nr:hypothetical protein [Rhizobium leguminosarum]